jgi:hypothetical protein
MRSLDFSRHVYLYIFKGEIDVIEAYKTNHVVLFSYFQCVFSSRGEIDVIRRPIIDVDVKFGLDIKISFLGLLSGRLGTMIDEYE